MFQMFFCFVGGRGRIFLMTRLLFTATEDNAQETEIESATKGMCTKY